MGHKLMFRLLISDSNLIKEQSQAIRFLANSRSIVIKKADKESCVVQPWPNIVDKSTK